MKISSRTDAGVHALANTAHFDLALNESYSKCKTSRAEIGELIKNSINENMIRTGNLIR